MTMTFLKSTVLPRPSVNWPSSKTWSKMLKDIGVGFLDFVEQDDGIR